MSSFSVAGIIIDVAALLLLAFFVLLYFAYDRDLTRCKEMPSTFCYTISCPCDDPKQGPCFGYAKRPSGDGNWYCSSAPYTKVNDDGKKV